MKSLWNSFKIAFAMFSKIPMPQADWSKENMKYMFCFFPFIGAVIGAFSLLAAKTGWYFGIGNGFLTVILVLIPVVITGGIHVDGLLDTSDALSSWRDREKRLEILKDSHAGAFAVITACVYFMAFYGGYSQINDNWKALCIMALGFCVSRCLSGLGVLSLPKANASGTVAEFSRKAEDRPVRITLIIYLIFLLAADVYIQPIWGISAFITAILVFVFYRYKAMKYFGGTTGDLAGYFLCLCEVWSVLILAVVTVVFP
nr:adenosylcobinamide-GDP ribazoletransferase [uncultured Blautia sp.]